jgi:hypothetical protein
MIQINSKVLRQAMQLAASALPNVAMEPVQEYVKLEVMGRIGYVTGIGGELSVKVGIDPEALGGGGDVLLPAALVLSAIDGLDTQITVKKDSLVWSGGKLTFGQTEDNYPEFRVPERGTLLLDGNVIADAIATVLPLADAGAPNAMFQHVWIDNASGAVYAGGYNSIGRSLYESDGADFMAGISKEMANKVVKLLRFGGDFQVAKTPSSAIFQAEWVDFTLNQPATTCAPFLDFFSRQKEIPGYFDAVVSCKQLKAIVSSMESTFGHSTIDVSAAGGFVTVSFKETMGGRQMVRSLPIPPGGPDWGALFSSSFLGKQLALADNFQFKERTAPILFFGDHYEGILSPQFVK